MIKYFRKSLSFLDNSEEFRRIQKNSEEVRGSKKRELGEFRRIQKNSEEFRRIQRKSEEFRGSQDHLQIPVLDLQKPQKHHSWCLWPSAQRPVLQALCLRASSCTVQNPTTVLFQKHCHHGGKNHALRAKKQDYRYPNIVDSLENVHVASASVQVISFTLVTNRSKVV